MAHLPDEAQLELIGGWDSREEERLRALARELGVERRVHFAGHRDRPEIAARLRRSATPSSFPVRWEEPWGLVPLEAMGRGPAGGGDRARRLGRVPARRRELLLFEAGDADALAAAIEASGGRPDAARRLRAGGLETAPKYTEAVLNEAVERALDERRRSSTVLR